MPIKQSKNKYVWSVSRIIKWSSWGNLLFIYFVAFITCFSVLGYNKCSANEIVGSYIIAGFILLVWLGLSLFFTFSFLKNSSPNFIDKKKVIKFYYIPFGFIVNLIYLYKLRKQNITRLGEAKREPMSCQALLFILTIIVVLGTWLMYACLGHTSTVDNDGNIINHTIPGLVDIILSPIKGFIDGAEVIVYLLIMGAFLGVINQTQALEAGIGRLVKKLKGKELIIIPVIMILFSLGGTTFGMCEETIAFYGIIMPIVLAAGFDAVTGVMIILFGAGLGVCSSIINPFMIFTSVDAINKQLGTNTISAYDGMVFRLMVYIVLLTIGITFVSIYAKKIKNNPKKSVVYDLYGLHSRTFSFSKAVTPEFTTKRKVVLIIFVLCFVMLIAGAIPWDTLTDSHFFETLNDRLTTFFPFLSTSMGPLGAWYLASFAGLFLTATFAIGIMFWTDSNKFLNTIAEGAKDFIRVCIVISLARGLSLILTSSGLGDIIAQGIAPALGINAFLGTALLYIIFLVLSIFMPSTTGFSYTVVGPIAAPAMIRAGMPSLASGIASSAIANGIINFCSPTAGVFVIGCDIAKVPLGKFYKVAWKLLLIVFLAGMGMLLLTAIPGMPVQIIGK